MPAFELHSDGFPLKAASAISINAVLGLDTGDVQRQVIPLATNNVEPFALAIASAPTPGDALTGMVPGDVVKAVAAASLGHGTDVGIASTNGALGPVAAASGVVRWRVGRSVSAAAAGETFSLYISPRQLGGLA